MPPETNASAAQYSCHISGQVFQVLTLTVHEAMSRLFRLRLTLWKDDPDVAVASMVRQNAEVRISWAGNEKKYFGLVTSFSQTRAGRPGTGGVDEEYGEYAVEIQPTLWLLGRKANCRIFQEKSAKEIILQVLDERGMSGKYDDQLSGSYPTRKFCVQYRETDLAFISRLMEEEGAYYYFSHDSEEKMVLGDSTSAYGTCAPEDSVEFRTASGDLSTGQEYISDLVWEENAYTGKVKLKDYDYENPTQPLRVEHSGSANTDNEIYDYHVERYKDDGRGRALARLVVEAQEALKKTITGTGTWRSASCGCKVTLSRAYRSDLNREWVIIATDHNVTQDASGGVKTWASWAAIPSDVTFRPVPHTPQPIMKVQTAKVVGPSGEKFYMDDKGRAKVQFHWDLEGSNDEDSSCWIRVAQPYAGMDEDTHKKHGFQWHPMIGDEVVVDFLEGDPDNPLIVGSVYNGVNTPIVEPSELVRTRILTPYQHQLLMDDKGSTVRLNTGGSQELIMGDKGGGEGAIAIQTSGGEYIGLEDGNDTFGNTIALLTADDHKIILTNGSDLDGIKIKTTDEHKIILTDSDHGILIRTENGHEMALQDQEEQVRITTVNGHKVLLDDADQKINISSAGGAHVKLDDMNSLVEISTPSGQQKIVLSYGGTGITLEATTGDIEISAPSGDITLSALNITLDATQKAEVKGMTGVDIKATSGTVKTQALNVEDEATISHKISANVSMEHKSKLTASFEGEVMASLKGGIASVEGTMLGQLKGMLVKIN